MTPWAVLLGALTWGCADGGAIDPGPAGTTAADSGAQTSTDPEHVPGHDVAWTRDERIAPGPLTFTELLYQSPTDPGLEWIELHNPLAFDLDISGWSLADGVDFGFQAGTVVPADGYLVVAADPALLEAESGYSDALGPYDGQLSNGGERLELRNNTGRLIDTVAYGDDEPWPVHADGTGLSLAKVDADAASDHAEHWTGSAELGGTPGAPNSLDPLLPPVTLKLVPEDATWTYAPASDAPSADWTALDFDDGDWGLGQAPLFAGEESGQVDATVWVTADNYFAVYLGHEDGSELRWIGEDSDADWTTVEAIDFEVSARDHLYLAAWELPGDSSSPQMTIAEVALPNATVGTDAASWEWVLGPVDANPGATPPDPAPSDAAIEALIRDAAGTWSPPAVEADRSSDPWGWATGGFASGTRFIWADTFDNDSITNVDNTYALFRSLDPLVGEGNDLDLDPIPVATRFRTVFAFDDDPSTAALSLQCLVDDGAVVLLNGTELWRHNLPDGAPDETTLALEAVGDPVDVFAGVSAEALVRGDNVLAVQVHQAQDDDPDLAFACSLTAALRPASAEPPVVLNEVAASSDPSPWVELLGLSTWDLDGLVLATSSGEEALLEAGELGPGELWLLDDTGLELAPGEVLMLFTADRATLLDAVRVASGPRAREADAGPWRSPAQESPGEPNVIALTHDVVIHEIQYHRAPVSRPDEPVTARDEEWIELFNRGDQPIDLGGWQLVDAVAFDFPAGTVIEAGELLVVAGDAAALQAEHPDVAVVGDWAGRLDNRSDRISLNDAAGNPADEVRYHDGGRWPTAADGGGSSLELRDPWADNAVPEAWAASDEAQHAEWVSISQRGVAEPSAVGPDGAWEELVLGLLDAGEVLVDDLSVVLDPDGVARELLQDGTFDADPDSWRLLGNHRHSELVGDPDDPANTVLRVVATGPTGHMHNHVETTLVQALGTQEVEVSFRARWVSGSNQLHSRLYFNRLPFTTRVLRPDRSGTPGQPNSVAGENLGPTLTNLAQDVAVPAPNEPVEVTVSADDPDGVAAVTLWSSVAGGPWTSESMSPVGPSGWQGQLAGQAAGELVQFYVEAVDERGAAAMAPAAGSDSRALVTWDDGLAATHGLHNLRILMTPDDNDWLHEDVNLMSNDPVGATAVYDEREVFYDVGVRAKGSERGRPETLRLGYGVRFPDDQPFRGSHSTVLIDRSEGVGYGQREVLMNLVMTAAGSVSGEYNDLVQLIAPWSAVTGPAELQLDRFSGLVLDAQFDQGASGGLFEYELIYYPRSTDDGTAEGLKLPQPDSVIGVDLVDLGEDPEDYRWNFLIKRNAAFDDYDGMIRTCQTLGLSGAALLDGADDVIDVDQWLRGFAFATVSGATDQYGGAGSQHNAQFYWRPSDQRMLFFPHDLDYFGSASMSVVGNSDLASLLAEPAWLRSYYGHLDDILGRSYSADYLGPWCDQLGELLPGQDFDSHCRFVDDRASWIRDDASDSVSARFPWRAFAITTGGGSDLTVATDTVLLEGQAWIDVRQIALQGAQEPLALTWVDETTWRVVVALDQGTNDVVLVATGLQGEPVGTDEVLVTYAPG